jgi:hypothetical protein
MAENIGRAFSSGMNAVEEETERGKLLSVAREFYARVVYTQKTHENNREIWTRRASIAKTINVALAGLTTILAVISGVQSSSEFLLVTTATVAGLNTAFVIFQLSFDPSGKSDEHKRAAKELLIVRDRYLLLIERIPNHTGPLDEVRGRLEVLCAELQRFINMRQTALGRHIEMPREA